MRFLCLHGKGTSAAIFRSQTASFRLRLDPSFEFDFRDAPFASTPAAGIDLFYPPPYYSFWEGTAVSSIRAAHQWLLDLIDRDGPYDGVMLFSQGCALISSFLLYHMAERPDDPIPFKTAIFICGGVGLPVVEALGIPVSQEAKDWDERTRHELQAQAAAIELGQDRWTGKPLASLGGASPSPSPSLSNGRATSTPTPPPPSSGTRLSPAATNNGFFSLSNGNSGSGTATPVLENTTIPKSWHGVGMTRDGEAPPGATRNKIIDDMAAQAALDPTNVFGFDCTAIPQRLIIPIPTVHIYGSKDPRYPASLQLAQFCDPSVRRMYDHEGGHDVPRNKFVSESIAELVKWTRDITQS
ncbi:hypothetical protein L228DRAFT_264758 [Xylona heveae TC161]|uniref:Serine hydrolase domain-containing protein n=1 Tax=Xylona heveae (strain CBS 132557 / TC161) TaxID=1328760 RepID=A0A165JKJ2_XYLHT|nr:hypothetical protein L228DRAFT_264758 [Xylona heveae TC161]KZF26351.1 hypothetical protein L228DRAFT_264758 [Xylona heveae TC161]